MVIHFKSCFAFLRFMECMQMQKMDCKSPPDQPPEYDIVCYGKTINKKQ